MHAETAKVASIQGLFRSLSAVNQIPTVLGFSTRSRYQSRDAEVLYGATDPPIYGPRTTQYSTFPTRLHVYTVSCLIRSIHIYVPTITIFMPAGCTVAGSVYGPPPTKYTSRAWLTRGFSSSFQHSQGFYLKTNPPPRSLEQRARNCAETEPGAKLLAGLLRLPPKAVITKIGTAEPSTVKSSFTYLDSACSGTKQHKSPAKSKINISYQSSDYLQVVNQALWVVRTPYCDHNSTSQSAVSTAGNYCVPTPALGLHRITHDHRNVGGGGPGAHTHGVVFPTTTVLCTQ